MKGSSRQLLTGSSPEMYVEHIRDPETDELLGRIVMMPDGTIVGTFNADQEIKVAPNGSVIVHTDYDPMTEKVTPVARNAAYRGVVDYLHGVKCFQDTNRCVCHNEIWHSCPDYLEKEKRERSMAKNTHQGTHDRRHQERRIMRDGRVIYRDATPEPTYSIPLPFEPMKIEDTLSLRFNGDQVTAIDDERDGIRDSGDINVKRLLKMLNDDYVLEKKIKEVTPDMTDEEKSLAKANAKAKTERSLARQIARYDDRISAAQSKVSDHRALAVRTRVGAGLSVPVIIGGSALFVFISAFIGITVMVLGLFFLVGFIAAGNKEFASGKDDAGFFNDPRKEIAYCEGQKRELNEKLEDLYLEMD